MQLPATPERRQSLCPQCATRGVPIVVRMQNQTRCITLRCDRCGTQWSASHPLHATVDLRQPLFTLAR